MTNMEILPAEILTAILRSCAGVPHCANICAQVCTRWYYTMACAGLPRIGMCGAAASAASAGECALIEWYGECGYTWTARDFAAAAGGGHMRALMALPRGDWRAIESAAAAGHSVIVEWLLSVAGTLAPPIDMLRAMKLGDKCRAEWCAGETPHMRALVAAAGGGHVQLVEQLYAQVDHPSRDGMASADAARGGHVCVLEWLHKRGAVSCERALFGAISSGHMHVLEWCESTLSVSARGISGHLIALAGKRGCIGVIEWLWSRTRARMACARLLGKNAARAGHVHVLEWMCAHAITVAPAALDEATVCGRVAVMQWMIDRGVTVTDNVVRAAASNGTATLQWLSDHGYAPGPSAWRGAASHGNVEAIWWLHERGVPVNATACRAAAVNNRPTIVRLLHLMGAPWDEGVCAAFARHGNLSAIQYAREHGAPWDAGTRNAALIQGHMHVVEYTNEHGCPV